MPGSGLFLSSNEKDPIKQNTAIKQLIEGRSNAAGVFTLTASAATSTITAPTCSPSCAVIVCPATANAAAEIGNGTMYIAEATIIAGSFVVTHANNAQTDRTFRYVCIG